ncbi:MAG: hypothetical protein KJ954_14385, partial [Alphaproteobacteria bacterium]|nr:hypothetical protein [Alphaproteobacteria bacterium]
MAIERLKYILGLEGDKEVRRQLKEFGHTLDTESKGVIGTFKRMGEGFTSLKTLMAAGWIYLAGRVVSGAASMIKGVADVAESHRLMQQSFQQLAKTAGQSADGMLAAMKRGVQGTVTEMDLMKAANNAILLGLPVTEESMEQLTRAALRLGRAMGRSATDAVNDLTIGIGRQSRLILDNLGLIVDTEKAYADYAKSLRKSVDALTEAEKKLAFYNAAMDAAEAKSKALADVTGGLSEQYAKLNVKWDDTKRNLGEALMPVMRAAVALTMEWARETKNLVDQIRWLGQVAGKPFEGRGGQALAAAQAENARRERMEQATRTGAYAAGLGRGQESIQYRFTGQTFKAELPPGPLGTGMVVSRSAPSMEEQLTAERMKTLAGQKLADNLGEPLKYVAENSARYFVDVPKKMEDQFDSSLRNIEAQMQALGMRGAGIFGGIANIRAGFMGLGVTGLGGSAQLMSFFKSAAFAGQLASGFMAAGPPIANALVGGLVKSGLLGFGGGAAVQTGIGLTASEEAQRKHEEEILIARQRLGVLETFAGGGYGDRQSLDLYGVGMVTKQNVAALQAQQRAMLEGLIA